MASPRVVLFYFLLYPSSVKKRTEEQSEGHVEGCGFFIDGNEGKEHTHVVFVCTTAIIPDILIANFYHGIIMSLFITCNQCIST